MTDDPIPTLCRAELRLSFFDLFAYYAVNFVTCLLMLRYMFMHLYGNDDGPIIPLLAYWLLFLGLDSLPGSPKFKELELSDNELQTRRLGGIAAILLGYLSSRLLLIDPLLQTIFLMATALTWNSACEAAIICFRKLRAPLST